MSVMRSMKNIVNNYTDAEVKVREATSNDPWGPSSTLMAEIADLTYNVVAFTEIMQMIWKRLNDHGKNWRHVYKALTLLEYIIKTGSEKVSQQCKENVFAIQTLKDFQYTEEGKDHGVNVREKAKALVSLLKDDDRLKNERAKALKAKERLSQSAFGIGSEGAQTHFGGRSASKFGSGNLRASDSFGSGSPDARRPGGPPTTELEEARPSSAGEEELQLQLALAMSKEEAEAEEKRRRQDELKLQLALEESRKENASAPADAAAAVPPLPLPGAPGGSASFRAGQSAAMAAAESSTAEKLLDFDLPTPKVKNDPWAAVTLSAPVQADPFQPVASVPPPAVVAVDPWSVPAPAAVSVSTQPASAAAFDPWSASSKPSTTAALPPVAAVARDPWSMPAPAAAPAAALPNKSSSSSPWDVLPSNGVGVQANGSLSLAAAPSDEFETVFKRTAPTTASSASGSGSAGTSNGVPTFDLGGMGQALQPADRKAKGAEDFLGANAKLVNLDTLVTKTPPSVAAANMSAFGSAHPPPSLGLSAGAGYGSSVHSNPFAAQQPPRPSLLQMSTSSSFGQLPQSGVAGQPPMMMAPGSIGMPVSAGYAGGGMPYYPASTAFVSPAPPPQQSYNPFL